MKLLLCMVGYVLGSCTHTDFNFKTIQNVARYSIICLSCSDGTVGRVLDLVVVSLIPC